MRIIAGKFRGRKLLDSSHLKALRPTTDANRESLFNILSAAKFIREIDFEITNCQIIDVCCGSGAVAFEALSRGAKSAILIDNSRVHLELAKKNSELLKVENQCSFLFSDVKNIAPSSAASDASRSLIFIDPPYDADYQNMLNNLVKKNWIKEGDLLVVEATKNSKINFDLAAFKLLEVKNYGITSFSFLIKNLVDKID